MNNIHCGGGTHGQSMTPVHQGSFQRVRLTPMRAATIRSVMGTGMVVMLSLAGCVTTQPQADGSTKVRVSLGNFVKPSQEANDMAGGPTRSQQAAKAEPAKQTASNTVPAAPSIRATALAGLFAKHPFAGTARTHYPRVAITVTDWSRSDCWTAVATVWQNKTKSESVPPFSVCWGQSLGYAVNNAANLHLFMQQSAVEHSGNVRTIGPKPPMMAIPDRQPINESQQLAFQGFIQQLVIDTGWKPGAPTNFWLVGYASQPVVSSQPMVKPATAASIPMDAKAKSALEQALSCAGTGKSFGGAEQSLKQVGWRPDQGVMPISLAQQLKVLGLSTQKIAVSRDGGEQVYRSYLPGVSLQQVVKTASLKLGKDGKTYGRLTKHGVLSAGEEGSETTLTCTVNVEGEEG
jgi:hypothetical protein